MPSPFLSCIRELASAPSPSIDFTDVTLVTDDTHGYEDDEEPRLADPMMPSPFLRFNRVLAEAPSASMVNTVDALNRENTKLLVGSFLNSK